MITAVIITKNEERNIGRCLASLQGVADEIIVLDSHSTDQTESICNQHAVRFIRQDWLGYSATKNLGNSLASHPYILSLDADEALSEDLTASILVLKPNLDGAYSFNRLAFYCGRPIRHGGWYPDEKIRLFPKGGAEWKGDFVHEELVPANGLTLGKLNGDLLHFTYYSTEEHIHRAKKYASLAADAMRTKGKGRLGLALKAVFSPGWRFFSMYLLKLGFLDGKSGWDIARITAKEVWWKYTWALKPANPSI